MEADQSGRSFPFPIPTINIQDDFDWQDDTLNALLFEVAAKYGSPYFAHHSRYAREKMNNYNKLYEKPSGFWIWRKSGIHWYGHHQYAKVDPPIQE